MKINLKNCSNCGKLVMLIGLLVAIPLVVLPFYKEEIKYAIAFIIPSVISFIIGIII